MGGMRELEKTFLAKYLPDLQGSKSREVIDIYLPKSSEHPKLRIRKNGESFEITKKTRSESDPAMANEETIEITEEEFEPLSGMDGKMLHKTRYFYDSDGTEAQIGVFQEGLSGLVLIDFEFADEAAMNAFKAPDFCLRDVTDERFLAGSLLCGKSYADIEDRLNALGYIRLKH